MGTLLKMSALCTTADLNKQQKPKQNTPPNLRTTDWILGSTKQENKTENIIMMLCQTVACHQW